MAAEIISEPQYLEIKITCLVLLIFSVRVAICMFKVLKRNDSLVFEKDTVIKVLIKFCIDRLNDLLIAVIGGLSLVELDNLVFRSKAYSMYKNIVFIIAISFIIKLILKFIYKKRALK